MDLAKVLMQLHEELANLDAAIESLERLQSEGRRRGRPPRWMEQALGKKRGRPPSRKVAGDPHPRGGEPAD